MNEVTVTELDQLLTKCSVLKNQHDDLKTQAAQVWHQYTEATDKLIAHLVALGRTEYKAGDYSFSFKEVSNYKVPKDDENRDKFFGYLKDKGIYDNFVTVNSMTLNAFAKTEEAEAEQRGDFDFQIPGLIKGEPYFQPTLRRNRK